MLMFDDEHWLLEYAINQITRRQLSPQATIEAAIEAVKSAG